MMKHINIQQYQNIKKSGFSGNTQNLNIITSDPIGVQRVKATVGFRG